MTQMETNDIIALRDMVRQLRLYIFQLEKDTFREYESIKKRVEQLEKPKL